MESKTPSAINGVSQPAYGGASCRNILSQNLRPSTTSKCRGAVRLVREHLPVRAARTGGGRRRLGIGPLNGIWYVMRAGCQWKAVHRTWFGASVASCMSVGLEQKARERALAALVRSTAVSVVSSGAGRRWTVARALRPWAAARRARTRRTVPSWLQDPSLGRSAGCRWPLTSVAPTNTTNGRSALGRACGRQAADFAQHFCGDKGYDFDDVRRPSPGRHVPHIKRKRRRGEPLADDHPVPGETQYPARRWVVGGPLVGWSNGVAYALAGVRNQPTGWPSPVRLCQHPV